MYVSYIHQPLSARHIDRNHSLILSYRIIFRLFYLQNWWFGYKYFKTCQLSDFR